MAKYTKEIMRKLGTYRTGGFRTLGEEKLFVKRMAQAQIQLITHYLPGMDQECRDRAINTLKQLKGAT